MVRRARVSWNGGGTPSGCEPKSDFQILNESLPAAPLPGRRRTERARDRAPQPSSREGRPAVRHLADGDRLPDVSAGRSRPEAT